MLGRAVPLTIAVAGLLLLGPAYTSASSAPPIPAFGPLNTHINHVVIIMMENRAFDNYFGVYCPTTGAYCSSAVNGEHAGLCVPKNPSIPTAGCIRPYYLGIAGMHTHDLPHDYNNTVTSINHGAMNGFYFGEGATPLTFGHFGGRALSIYWDLAEEYALGENFFSSAISYSLPNHWYLLAGQAPPQTKYVQFTQPTWGFKHAYLNASNRTQTVEDLLNRTPGVSWKYYDWTLPSYQTSIGGGWGNQDAYNYWSPLAAKHESYTHWYLSHFVSRSGIFSDAANGTLPNISWVIPQDTSSDHAQTSNISTGESYVAQTVDAIEKSPEWNSTAIFLSWDDYGGWYDGVAPPHLDSLGLSVRVPLLVISPYTPVGRVVSGLGYFESLLHFVEWRFNLGSLTSRDRNAPLPFAYFNFNQTSRAPIQFPTNYTNASYPMALQADPLVGFPCPNVCTLTPDAWDSALAEAAAANLTLDQAD
jgi:phospholipase C